MGIIGINNHGQVEHGEWMMFMPVWLGLDRVMAWTTFRPLPTWSSWGFWWSSRQGRPWPPWRTKLASWLTTELQVKQATDVESHDAVSTSPHETMCYITRNSSPAILCYNVIHPNTHRLTLHCSVFLGKLTDAFSSLAKKSHFRALSRRLNLVGNLATQINHHFQCLEPLEMPLKLSYSIPFVKHVQRWFVAKYNLHFFNLRLLLSFDHLL